MRKLVAKKHLEDGSVLLIWSLGTYDRPVEIIHYFDQHANYLESLFITEQKELMKIEKTPVSANKPRIFWKKVGKANKGVFNINTYIYPDDEMNNAFWGAVKECFNKREPKVDVWIPSARTRYTFIVQYLVKEKVVKKSAATRPSADLLAE